MTFSYKSELQLRMRSTISNNQFNLDTGLDWRELDLPTKLNHS